MYFGLPFGMPLLFLEMKGGKSIYFRGKAVVDGSTGALVPGNQTKPNCYYKSCLRDVKIFKGTIFI